MGIDTLIGSTPDKPLRCSKLGEITKCTMRLFLMSQLGTSDDEDEGGEAAQTGSLTHVGVAEFHKLQQSSLDERKRKAWEAINASLTKFPLASPDDVRLNITPYMNDPRNINARCIAVEEELHFALPPHPIDESKLPIYVKGTLDQLRLHDNGIPYVYDLKTGKRTGWEMVHMYLIQTCAYTYGVREIAKGEGYLVRDDKKVGIHQKSEHAKLWSTAQPGPIIRSMGYRVRGACTNTSSPDGVLWPCPIEWDLVEDVLDYVRLTVALYRNGDFQFGPGGWCSYCEFGGIASCSQQYQRIQLKLRGS